jgi:hypothetical protein
LQTRKPVNLLTLAVRDNQNRSSGNKRIVMKPGPKEKVIVPLPDIRTWGEVVYVVGREMNRAGTKLYTWVVVIGCNRWEARKGKNALGFMSSQKE